MTLRPTDKNKQEWVKKYLNNGELPEVENETCWLIANNYKMDNVPCLEALQWLEAAKPDICTLEDAWDRCHRPDWMVWMLTRMNPSKADVRRAVKATYALVDKIYDSVFDEMELFVNADEVREDIEYHTRDKNDAAPKDRMKQLTALLDDLCMFEGAYFKKATNRKKWKEYCDAFREVYGNPWRKK